MQTGHTKGEWTNTGLEIRHKSNSLLLATVYKHLPANQSFEEAQANAKLMTAAPDLLEALIEMCDSQGRGMEHEIKAYDKAMDAILKATK